jgi:hypothetical protein
MFSLPSRRFSLRFRFKVKAKAEARVKAKAKANVKAKVKAKVKVKAMVKAHQLLDKTSSVKVFLERGIAGEFPQDVIIAPRIWVEVSATGLILQTMVDLSRCADL